MTKFTWNDLGERVTTILPSGQSSSYFYNQSGQMDSDQNATTYADYTYNGDGLRMSQKVASIATSAYTNIYAYTWDMTAAVPLLLTDGYASYIYGPGGLPVESVSTAGTVSFFHHDQLGSTTMLTSVTGTKLTTFTYSSYGMLLSGSPTTPLLYAGQYRDSETGFYYLQARYYDPSTAQFLTVDPLITETGTPYTFTHDDPVNATDASGLISVPLPGPDVLFDPEIGLYSEQHPTVVAVTIGAASVLIITCVLTACVGDVPEGAASLAAIRGLVTAASDVNDAASLANNCANGINEACVESGITGIADVVSGGLSDKVQLGVATVELSLTVTSLEGTSSPGSGSVPGSGPSACELFGARSVPALSRVVQVRASCNRPANYGPSTNYNFAGAEIARRDQLARLSL